MMRVTSSLLLVLLLSPALCGCSDDATTGSPDSSVDGPVTSPDSGADASASDGADDLSADLSADVSVDLAIDQTGGDSFATVTESEPNDGKTATEFNAITVPSVISGTIGTAGDADVFSFSAQAGDRLTVQASSLDAAQLHLAVFGDAALNVPAAVNAFGNGKDAFAEYYVLKSGTYYIALRDRRNVGSNPAGVGGPTFGYTITVAPLSRAPQAITVGQSKTDQITPAGTVRVYAFSAKKDDQLELRAKAKALTPASDVDTRLSLFHPGQKAWLGTNDNPSLSETDSLLQGKMPFTGTYHVVVENVADSGSDLRVEVSVDVKAP
jgi:hypothetical protein